MRYTRMRDWLSRSARDMRSRDMRNPYGSRGGYVTSDRRGRDYGYDRMGDMARNGQYSIQQSDKHYPEYDYARSGGSNQYSGQSSRDYYGDITRRDYGEEEYKLSPTEIRKWERELKQSGAKFTADQVRQVAQQHGIRFDEFSPELLTAVANMMYTDYDETVRGDIAMYVKLAKDFLCDEDFDGTPEEKAYLYYNVIVNKDDD